MLIIVEEFREFPVIADLGFEDPLSSNPTNFHTANIIIQLPLHLVCLFLCPFHSSHYNSIHNTKGFISIVRLNSFLSFFFFHLLVQLKFRWHLENLSLNFFLFFFAFIPALIEIFLIRSKVGLLRAKREFLPETCFVWLIHPGSSKNLFALHEIKNKIFHDKNCTLR